MNALINYDRAKAALEKAWKVDEVQDIRDSAVRAQLYARQAKDKTMLFQAAEIKLRAERRVGEILIRDSNNGVRLGQGENRAVTKKRAEVSRQTSAGTKKELKDYGASRTDAYAWQHIASIPEKKFNAYLEQTKKDDGIPTTKDVVRLAHDDEREEKRELADKREEKQYKKAEAEKLRKDREKVRKERERRAKLTPAERKAEDDAVAKLREEQAAKDQAELLQRRRKMYTTDSPFDVFCKLIDFASLRKAYTAEAQRLHPDRGGKPDEMARLNKAWAAVEEYLTGTEEPVAPLWRKSS